jgi:hypothetical protein
MDHAPLSRTFLKKAAAQTWARQSEAEIERGQLPADHRRMRSSTLADLLRM